MIRKQGSARNHDRIAGTQAVAVSPAGSHELGFNVIDNPTRIPRGENQPDTIQCRIEPWKF
jgi:hypothetical protein